MKNQIALFLLIVLLITGCQPSESAVQTAIAQTQNSNPLMSSTLTVSNTPSATNTLAPTNTLSPANTPIPTYTPVPIVLTGSGSDVVDVEIPFNMAIAHITGNAADRHFSVGSYNDKGDYLDLLVNTSNPFDGIVPVGFSRFQVTRFEVEAVGDWTIEILPLSSARTFTIPGKVTGNGCDIIVLVGGVPDIAMVTGNAQGGHFSIGGYDLEGNYNDLLVNTSDPFNGKVILGRGIEILVINSTDQWEIEITIR